MSKPRPTPPANAADPTTPGPGLLQIRNLTISFDRYATTGWSTARSRVTPARNIQLDLHEGTVTALVGASGSGKTLLAEALLGMYQPNMEVTGTIEWQGVSQDAADLQARRGRDIALIPQSVASLDPFMRVGRQIGGSREARHALYRRFRLDPGVDRLYPFQLSGGMARKVLCCLTLITAPRLIIADEPTPGLDRPATAQVLAGLRETADRGGAVLLITHDLEAALTVADRIAVMLDGTIVEELAAPDFAAGRSHHLFTRDLWSAAVGFLNIFDGDFSRSGSFDPVEAGQGDLAERGEGDLE